MVRRLALSPLSHTSQGVDLLDVILRVLKRRREARESIRGGEVRCSTAGLEDGGRSHQPGEGGDSRKPEETEKRLSLSACRTHRDIYAHYIIGKYVVS